MNWAHQEAVSERFLEASDPPIAEKLGIDLRQTGNVASWAVQLRPKIRHMSEAAKLVWHLHQ
jgi:hypothetical protein